MLESWVAGPVQFAGVKSGVQTRRKKNHFSFRSRLSSFCFGPPLLSASAPASAIQAKAQQCEHRAVNLALPQAQKEKQCRLPSQASFEVVGQRPSPFCRTGIHPVVTFTATEVSAGLKRCGRGKATVRAADTTSTPKICCERTQIFLFLF